MIRYACWILLLLLISLTAIAQNYEVLYSFAGAQVGDAAVPQGNLIFDSSGNLYGTTYGGGNAPACPSGCGTVFELSPNVDGTWTESVLYSFCSNFVNNICVDGYRPEGGLVADVNGNLYGTASVGGLSSCPNSSGCGTVFELSPPSGFGGAWNLSVLYSFCEAYVNNTCADGTTPSSRVTLDASGHLYGTTTGGGTANRGTVFELSQGSNGWTETILHSFCANGHGQVCPDGTFPYGGVTFDSSGNLYGTTKQGGSQTWIGGGTLYRLSPGPQGWTENVLFASHQPFSNGCFPLANVNVDPRGDLYTTTSAGGAANAGSVLKLSQNGGVSRSFVFDGFNGAFPAASVLLRGDAIYGTTSKSENSQRDQVGNVFKIDRSGRETVLYAFCQQTNCADGDQPVSGLVADHLGNLYGTTEAGGIGAFGGNGVVFRITP